MMKPYGEYKKTEYEWIGSIPSHWEICTLKSLLCDVSEKNHPEMPLLSVVRERGVIVRRLDDSSENHNVIPEDLSGYKMVKKKQFVMNKMKAWQVSYGMSDYDGIVSPAYYVFNLDFDNAEFFNRAIRNRVYVDYFARYSTGIRVGQWDFGLNRLREIPFAYPPRAEQDQIVRFLDWKNGQVNRLLRQICGKTSIDPKDLEKYSHSQIALLIEYRTRLISDVVTGKIDVRNIVTSDFDPVGDISNEIETADDFDLEDE